MERCYLTQLSVAHDAVGMLPSVVTPLDQEADDQEALDQEADDQLALDQEADDQLALDQDALFHEALACAALAQLAESNTMPLPESLTRNWFRPAFGFGGLETAFAAAPSTSPTPRELEASCPSCFALSIRAPLTWSGPQPECRARSCAAIPETTGAANEVPDIHMYPVPTVRSACSVSIVEPSGTAPFMYRPGAPRSGFEKPSSV